MFRTACMTAFALVCLGTAARAEDCGPLKQITSLNMTPLPGGRFMVPVTINGTQQQLLLNTAGGITSLMQNSANAMGLQPIDASHIKLLSTNGNVSQNYVQIDFQLGAIHDPTLQLIVTPQGGGNTPPFVGSLAGDFLGLNDAEMDFAGRKLNIFSKDHCPGHVLYWNPTAVAVLPITLQTATNLDSRTGYMRYAYRGSHIIVPVSIDGKDFKATINTGSPTSSMDMNTAKFIFGITADSPGSVPVKNGNDGDPAHQSFIHTFSSLTFDTVTVTNARFLVYPDLIGARDPNNGMDTENRARHFDDNVGRTDISIGMDVLRKLRLYVAYGERKLYVTPASAPAAATPAGAAPAASMAAPAH
jgi:hypothetical protein